MHSGTEQVDRGREGTAEKDRHGGNGSMLLSAQSILGAFALRNQEPGGSVKGVGVGCTELVGRPLYSVVHASFLCCTDAEPV